MSSDTRLSAARTIMEEIVGATGVDNDVRPRRYLWTDAFAVCNLLALHLRSGEERYLALARSLVGQVHTVLGRHRSDDPRRGWISGLDEEEGRRHPTAGGLRIGKPLSERTVSEPYDPPEEWDRDGQYFHYLTKWMWALHQIGRVTGAPEYQRWAVELARTSFHHFAVPVGGGSKRIIWKKSIDLSRAQVPSSGQHDALDGYVTFQALEATSQELQAADIPSLEPEIAELAGMLEQTLLITEDALGIGGLLTDAYRLAALRRRGKVGHLEVLEALVESAAHSLKAHNRATYRRPAEVRLAFRELGLAIGLHAVERLTAQWGEEESLPFGVRTRASFDQAIAAHHRTAEMIESFWLDPANRRAASWRRHYDINSVMLATSLIPEGYLG